MIWQQIPTIELIYNEFHKQKWYALNGIYPRTIKNFSSIYSNKTKYEYLVRFQNLLKRSGGMIDWKLYIYANAQLLKERFDLKQLGTLSGTKIYRNYMLYKLKDSSTEDIIYNDIITNLQFLSAYCKENNFKFKDYILENASLIPLLLIHLYAGTISLYFYSCLSETLIYKIFNIYQDDAYFELFNMNKYEFITNIILPKHVESLKYKKIRNIADKIDKIFLTEFNK